MQRATRILPIALAMAVSLAPAAMAARQGGGGGTTQQQAGMHQMLPGGISFKGQMDHAYSEALNAHESVVLGMNDMAANHLANIDLVLSHLEDQMGGGGGAQGKMMSQAMRTQLSTIRQEAGNLRGNMGDRQNALKGTSALVARFVAFYDTMAPTAVGGGGGMTGMMMESPTELVGAAAKMAAQTQAALAARDFEAASLHAKDAMVHLQKAEKAAVMTKMASSEVTRIRQLKQDATKVNGAVSGRSSDALKESGRLVTRIGTEMPRIAAASMGGGAGMQR